jgi:hypothetical protein
VIEQKIQASEARLKEVIEISQEETIDALSEVVHTGYNLHEKRISHIEEQLDRPHPKEN